MDVPRLFQWCGVFVDRSDFRTNCARVLLIHIVKDSFFFVHIITRKFQSPHHAVFCIIPHRALIFNQKQNPTVFFQKGLDISGCLC